MRTREREHQWIEGVSGHSRAWWVAFVQREIGKASSRSRDPRHDKTDPRKWLGALVKAVLRAFPKRGRYDGNMRAAAVLSYVLALWYLRIQRAKAYDPRRPIAGRQRATYENPIDCMGTEWRIPSMEIEDYLGQIIFDSFDLSEEEFATRHPELAAIVQKHVFDLGTPEGRRDFGRFLRERKA